MPMAANISAASNAGSASRRDQIRGARQPRYGRGVMNEAAEQTMSKLEIAVLSGVILGVLCFSLGGSLPIPTMAGKLVSLLGAL